MCTPFSKERKLFRLAGRGAWRREAQIVSPEAQLEFIYHETRAAKRDVNFLFWAALNKRSGKLQTAETPAIYQGDSNHARPQHAYRLSKFHIS